MNKLLMNRKYIKELSEYSDMNIEWNILKDRTIMLTGATGLVGRYFIDLIMYKNKNDKLNCTIIAVGRNEKKLKKLFEDYLNLSNFKYIINDVSDPIKYEKNIDYIVHGASNTHPIQYVEDPVGTLKTNILGTYNLLNLSSSKMVKKFVLISSFEVYGNVSNKEKIDENDFGVVNCTTIRSCYPESKRASESLCVAFSSQKNVNTSIVRLSRVFGPTMDLSSTLSIAEFIKNGIREEDIILKSDGSQLYSYNYVGDAVMAIIMVLLKGEDKEAYNVSDEKFDISLKSFVRLVANKSNTTIVFNLPNELEKKGFSNSTMTVLNSKKLKLLGWKVSKKIECRINDTIDVLKEIL